MTAGWEAAISLWDASSLRLLRRMEGHTSLVVSIAIDRIRRTLASAGIDGTDQNVGSRVRSASVRSFAPWPGVTSGRSASHPTGGQLATVSDTGTVRFWDVEAGETSQEAKTLRGHTGRVTCLAFSPDESRLITGSWDGTARIWRTATGEELGVLRHDGIVNAARFAPDGRTIITADDTSGAMTIWDAGSCQRLRSVRGAGAIAVPRFTPDGSQVVAIAGHSGIIRWNAATWSMDAEVDTGLPLGRMSAVSPDGSTLITANDSGQVRFWSVTSLRQRALRPPSTQAPSARSSFHRTDR